MLSRLRLPLAAAAVLTLAGFAQAQTFSADPNPLVPDLIYDPSTGGASISPDGFNIASFALQSDNKFLTNFTQDQLKADTFNITGLQDNTPSVVGWVSPLVTAGQGYTGANFNPAFIGNIFPKNLSLAQLGTLLTGRAYANLGVGGDFDLITVVPIPEPTTLAAVAGVAGLLATRRRRAV